MKMAEIENKKNIHAGHRKRLTQQFRANGLESFTDIQALEMLLFYAIPRQDTNEKAHLLLNYFKSFRGVMEADYEELLQVEGIGESCATLITFVRSLNMRYTVSKNDKRVILENSEQLSVYLRHYFEYRTREALLLLCMSKSRRVLSAKILCEGDEVSVPIPPNEILREATSHHAAKIVIAHNHLEKFANISKEDLSSTRLLKAMLAKFDVELFDHVVIAQANYVSFRDRGYL